MSQALPWQVGTCPQCEQPNRSVGPLHGEKGGPMFCIQCAMKWHGKHGRKRKLGRVVVKAIQLFFNAGGLPSDVKKLELRALEADLGWGHLLGIPDTIGRDVGDITSELLRDTLRLTHPDHHPPERRDLATRVTRELRALEPCVFPAPKPEPIVSSEPAPTRPGRRTPDPVPSTKPAYPCELCEDSYRSHYCTACRAELERRSEAKHDLQRHKQRAWYRTRQERRMGWQRRQCAAPGCESKFKPPRTDAKYCSPACRQRAYRSRRVTGHKADPVKLETGVTLYRTRFPGHTFVLCRLA